MEFDLVIADPNNNIKYISTIDFEEISEESKDAVKKCLERIPTLEEAVMVKRIDDVYDEVYTCTLKNGELVLKPAQKSKSKFLGLTFNKIFNSINYLPAYFELPEAKDYMCNFGSVRKKDYPDIKYDSYTSHKVVFDKKPYYYGTMNIRIWCAESRWTLSKLTKDELVDVLTYVPTIREVYLAISRQNYKVDVYRCTLNENGELVLSDNTYSELLGVDMKECVEL